MKEILEKLNQNRRATLIMLEARLNSDEIEIVKLLLKRGVIITVATELGKTQNEVKLILNEAALKLKNYFLAQSYMEME